MKAKEIAALEGLLGHHFQQSELLDQALTHSSQARELEAQQPAKDGQRPGDNEQLEFLGDAVLALVTGEELFRRFPTFREGELSKLRAHLVSERHLIQVAQTLGLGTYLRLGRGEEKSGGRLKTALLVDALEIARRFILQAVITPELARMNPESGGVPVMDFKSALQETLQATGRPQASYVLVKEAGPEHSKTFTVEVRLSSAGQTKVEFIGRAEGSTKKRAEQDAARQVLQYLGSLPPRAEEKVPTKPPTRQP
jgi:ribonuclease III